MNDTIKISEKEFLSQIIDLLNLFHWKVYHVFEQGVYARRTSKGFPDIVACRPPRLLFIEAKSENGKLSPDQEQWLDALKECRKTITATPISLDKNTGYIRPKDLKLFELPEIYIWKPSDFEEVEKCLR